MGGGPIYDGDITRAIVDNALSTGVSYMAYNTAVAREEVEAKVHDKLDPARKNSTGIIIREAFDLPEHPNSVPVAIIFDTTGSMRDLPEKFVERLPDLMELIHSKGYLADPQLLFGAVNDAKYSSIAPLEVGQFESSNQLDDVITKILLEGGGGPGFNESYELALYFMARHTDLDSFKKRNKKGYLFMIGDETPYDAVDKNEVKKWIGDDIQADIPTKDIVEELKRKFEVYWLFPSGAANGDRSFVRNRLQELFGQNVLSLKDSEDICPMIAATIAIAEGRNPSTVAEDLKAVHPKAEELVDALPQRRLDDLD